MSEDIKHHIVVYRNVFIALLALTGITVLASYIHFPYVWLGVLVGLLIACVKGFLVASQFMHLNNERNFIYGTLILTVVFFFVLLFMPLFWHTNNLSLDQGAFENVNHHTSDHHNAHGDH